MPVSHLGLTVSHIPSATSFYLSALQPLGYRFHGYRNNSIGLGVHEADFFLTQEPEGFRLAPTHIAFSADDRATVRNCYAAALRAGARPSGVPGHRQDDCQCFNAAVEDFDGNTIEFIWRGSDPVDQAINYGRPKSFKHTRTTPARSQAVDASPPRMGIQRSSTEPVSTLASKSLIGAVLGAAAGAALGVAMLSTERDSARREDYHNSYARSRRQSVPSRPSVSRRSASMASDSRSNRQVEQYLPAQTVVRRIDARPYHDDENISYVRRTLTRESQGRSRAVEAIEYGPSRYSARRSAALPIEPAASRPTSSRRDSVVSAQSRRASEDQTRSSHHPRSTTSKARTATSRANPQPSISDASTVRPLKRDSIYTAAAVPLPPSVTSRGTTRASTYHSAASRFDAHYLPAQESDDSDGLGDTATIVPEDSISCIDMPRRHRSRRSSKGGSVMTIPLRSTRDERGRSRHAYSHA